MATTGNLGLASYDVSKIFSLESLCDIQATEELEHLEDLETKCSFPDFGAHLLQQTALKKMCNELHLQTHKALAIVSDVPSVIVADRMCALWEKVLDAYSVELEIASNVKRDSKSTEKDQKAEAITSVSTLLLAEAPIPIQEEKRVGSDVLVEVGIKMSLSMVFTLLRHEWSQLAWQKQVEQALLQSGSPSLIPVPSVSLPNQVLRSVLGVLVSVPPLSLSNVKTMSQFSQMCLDQSMEFLQWVVNPSSHVDAEGKKLALQIAISLYLQRGSLVHILEWVESMLQLLLSYQELGMDMQLLTLDLDYCRNVLSEIRTRTVSCCVTCSLW
jgi:hypothetical protein